MGRLTNPKMSSISVGLIVFLTSLFPAAAFATGADLIPGSRYVSPRGAALGDAYIGLAEGPGESLFYNPAGLGRINGFVGEPLNIGLQGNSSLISGFGTDIYKFQSLDQYESKLQGSPGARPGTAYSVLPSFGFRGFGIGVLYQSRNMAESNGINLRYRTTTQLIPAAGFGLRLASGVLRIGYSLQYVSEVSVDKTVVHGTTPLGWTEGAAQGKGFSHTLGMALTLPYMYQPTVNVVARNIAGTNLSGTPLVVSAKNPAGSIAADKMSVDGALGFTTKVAAGWNLSTQFSYRDATNASGASLMEHFAAGLEFTAMDHIFIRAGYGSNYPSAGVGISTSRAEVNLTWYSEDIGTSTASSRDIRYLFQFAFRAF